MLSLYPFNDFRLSRSELIDKWDADPERLKSLQSFGLSSFSLLTDAHCDHAHSLYLEAVRENTPNTKAVEDLHNRFLWLRFAYNRLLATPE